MGKKNRFSSFFKSLDIFSQNVNFRENGGDSFGTIFGAFTTLMITFIVISYGFKKFLIIHKYLDTQLTEFKEKNGLTEEVIGTDETQFWIAFAVFDLVYSAQIDQHILSNEGHEDYISYDVSIYSRSGADYTLDEVLTTHRCNETDMGFLSKNVDGVDEQEMARDWPQYYCLDNPERVRLRQGHNSEDLTSLVIQAAYCREGNQCRSFDEIEEWKTREKMFAFYSNTWQFRANLYGDKMVDEQVSLFDQFDIKDKQLIYKLTAHEADSDEDNSLNILRPGKNRRKWFDIQKEPQVKKNYRPN